MPSSDFSSAKFYLSTIHFLKFIGAFPTKLEYFFDHGGMDAVGGGGGGAMGKDVLAPPKTKNLGKILLTIGYHTSGIYRWLNLLVVATAGIHALYHLGRLLEAYISDFPHLNKQYIFKVTWILSYLLRFSVLAIYCMSKSGLTKLLADWYEVERSILIRSSDSRVQKRQFWRSIFVLSCYAGYIGVFLCLLLVALANHSKGVKLSGFPLLMSYFTKVGAELINIHIAITSSFFEMQTHLLSASIVDCLKLQSYDMCAESASAKLNSGIFKNFEPTKGSATATTWAIASPSLPTATASTNQEFEIALSYYHALQNLIHQYNTVSSTIILYYKSFSLIANSFCVIYLAIHFSNGISSLSPVATIFIFFATLQLTRLSIMMWAMGRVYAESNSFKTSWITAMGELSGGNQQKLDLIEPFGFKCGELYMIVPTTVLNYFSQITNYTILVLQIFSMGYTAE